MKNTLLFFSLLFFPLSVFAQPTDFGLHGKIKVYGMNLLDSSDIFGMEYSFPDLVEYSNIDRGFLTVQTRGVTKKHFKNKGEILQFDLSNQSLLWRKNINYRKERLYENYHTHNNSALYISHGKREYYIDRGTGEELWQKKTHFLYYNDKAQIGLGYSFTDFKNYGESSNELLGVNLRNGKVLWKKELLRDYGWNELIKLSDTTVIIIAEGMHFINLKNGQGWDYNAVTGAYPVTGPFTEVNSSFYQRPFEFHHSASLRSSVWDIASNAYIDGNNIYFASREEIVNINKNTGKTIWASPLPIELTSSSLIKLTDSFVFIINRGGAQSRGKAISFGKPFIAAFDKMTGEQLYLRKVGTDIDTPNDYKVSGNILYLAFDHRIEKISIATGKLLLEKQYDKEKYGLLAWFDRGYRFFANENEDYKQLKNLYPSELFISKQKGGYGLIGIDQKLNITREIRQEDIMFYYYSFGSNKMVWFQGKRWIINKEGRKIASIFNIDKLKEGELEPRQFYHEPDPIIIDQTIFAVSKGKLVVIDLDSILE